MKYHDIVHDDMMNGDGLRVVLFVSGCNHYCKGCQNPQTWDANGGIEFDEDAINEIYKQLSEDYIEGITFSGGDPLYSANLHDVYDLILNIRNKFPDKNIWLYTGYSLKELKESKFAEDKFRLEIISLCDVIVDGMFMEELKDTKYPWAGSTNQNVIRNIK